MGWLEDIQAQLPEGYEIAPTPPAGMAAPSPGAVGYTPPVSASPSAPSQDTSLWGGFKAGAAQDGLVGGLVGAFANPQSADPSAYQAVTGILRNVGRAIGSAYGNPTYALQARAVDQRDQALAQQRQRDLIGLQNDLLDRTMRVGTYQAQQAKDKRMTASAQAVAEYMQGHDFTPENVRKAASMAFSLGDSETGTKLLDAAQKAAVPPKAPEHRRILQGDNEVDQEMGPDGQWNTVGSGPRFKDPTAPKDTTSTTEKTLRNEFVDQSKDFQTVRNMYETIKGASSGSNHGVSDMSMIFAFMKIVDPTSTVREGEYASAKNSGSIPQYVVNSYNKALQGDFLTPEQRQQFVQEAGNIYGVRKQQHAKLEQTYRGLAERNRANPDNVVLDFNEAGAAPAPAAAAPMSLPAGAKPTNRTSGGKPVYEINGELFVVE